MTDPTPSVGGHGPHGDHTIDTPTFARDHLPVGEWREYRKILLTPMVRIDGPFIVETNEGPLRCEDGYLAVDARGFPYPIAAEEHALIYEVVEAPR